MALGLSVIFGVVRVVNFAHGEMMTLAMYLTLVLFTALAAAGCQKSAQEKAAETQADALENRADEVRDRTEAQADAVDGTNRARLGPRKH